MGSLSLAVFGGLLLLGLVAGLLPVKSIRLALGTLLAADAATLAPATNANKIALIAAAFTPGEDLTLADLTLASFTGSTPIAGAAGTQGTGNDPATGDQVITILAPAGGWRWTCSAAPTPAQAIYGYALVDNAVANLLGVQLLPAVITIASVGDEIDLGAVTMTFVTQPLS